MVELMPIARPSVRMMTAANPGWLARKRVASRKSCLTQVLPGRQTRRGPDKDYRRIKESLRPV